MAEQRTKVTRDYILEILKPFGDEFASKQSEWLRLAEPLTDKIPTDQFEITLDILDSMVRKHPNDNTVEIPGAQALMSQLALKRLE